MPSIVKEITRHATIVIGLALVFAFLGIYATNGQSFIDRFWMWTITIGVGSVAAIFITPMFFEREPCASWPVWVQLPLAAGAIALPVTITIILLEASDGKVTPAIYWPLNFFYVFVVSQVLTIGGYIIQSHREARELVAAGGIPGSAPVSNPAVKFLERLPPRYRGAVLYAVSSEDHYLRVHTSLGEELILMRLSDAVSELEGAPGLQVHRSWWVAPDGVADVSRKAGKPVISLKSGGQAPVSRTYQKAAREAGLI